MAISRIERLLARLEQARRRYGRTESRGVEQLLRRCRDIDLPDAQSLLRWHDSLLFLRAFPHSSRIARIADQLLGTVPRRVAELAARGADLSLFDDEKFSGIAGSEIVDSPTFEDTCWLVNSFPEYVSIAWDGDISSARLANTWPRLMPLLDEDGFAEPDTPYRTWLDSARGQEHELAWLLRRFAALPLPQRQQAELYESLELPVRWQLRDLPISRTRARRPVDELYCHARPLLKRSDVSLARELSVPLLLETLPQNEGEKIIQMARAALTVRYRSLYGMTFGAPPVYRAAAGRGTEIFVWGVPPERRFPLRAYCSGFTLKNGVPINYLEAIALSEWMEIGFNTFYAFREGETAWVYAQVLRALYSLLGMSCISVYPYQIGQDNEEAIQSGAFWFYRKLGFRPGRPEIATLVEGEERRMARNAAHRTPAPILRKIAQGHIFYELPETPRGDWDRFRTRHIGFAVQRRMAAEFAGDADRFRAQSTERLASALDIPLANWAGPARDAFVNFACVLSLIPDVERWTTAEKARLAQLISAKAEREEWEYLRLLREHPRLRSAIMRLGSTEEAPARAATARKCERSLSPR